MNEIERRFATALTTHGIRFKCQVPAGWRSSPYTCGSLFPCRCGIDWSDPDTGDCVQGYSDEPHDAECDWLRGGTHVRYFIDFVIPMPFPLKDLAIEIDGSWHSEGSQPNKDSERQQWIEKNKSYEFLRLPSWKVRHRIRDCIAEIEIYLLIADTLPE